MSFEESFLYPLILLVIGVVTTFASGTYLPRKYQEKQKQQKIEQENRTILLDKQHEVTKLIVEITVQFNNSILEILESSGSARKEKINKIADSLWSKKIGRAHV